MDAGLKVLRHAQPICGMLSTTRKPPHHAFHIYLTGGLHGQLKHGALFTTLPFREDPQNLFTQHLKEDIWAYSNINSSLLENFQVYYKSLLLSPVSLCKILRRWIYSK
jgi:hypothetical protein